MKIKNDFKIVAGLSMQFIGTLLLLTIITPISLNAQDKNSNTMENNKTILQDGFNKWACDSGSFFDLLTNDVQWTITGSTPLSKTYTSKKQFMDEVINPLNDRLAKRFVPTVTGIYTDGDMVIVVGRRGDGYYRSRKTKANCRSEYLFI
jgi:ketosteroid isomerase-like protein